MWAKFGQKVGSMFMGKTPKNKMTIAKFKAKKNLNKIKSGFKKASKKAISLTDKYPKTTFATGLVGAGALYGNTEGARVRQNQIIEMQKAGIVATVAAPKAIFLGAGYLAGKDKDKDK